MKYFSGVVQFVNNNIFWVFIAFAAAFLIETIIFIIRKIKSGDEFETDAYYVSIATNVVVILGVYILACLGVGLVNCIKDQDWHFWTHFWGFIQSEAYKPIAIGVGSIGAIVMVFVYKIKFDHGFIVSVILAVLTAAIGVVALTVAGFIIYVLISVLIILLKVLWFVISGFFVSMWGFITNYWIWILSILFVPGIIYGAIKAFINYIKSFKESIIDKGV